MSVNSSHSEPSAPQKKRRWSMLFLLPAWTLVGFLGAQLIIVGLVWLLAQIGITFDALDESVLNASLAAIIYIVSLLIVIGIPKWVKQRATTLKELGLDRLPRWQDIGLAPLSYIGYMIVLVLVSAALVALIPSFDIEQAQEVGFDSLTYRYEFILAFVTLVIIAPIAEEILLRGYLYGKLRRAVPIWVAALVVSALFGALHGQWNVAVDTFILSMVMCGLREITGSIWAGILLHMIKNGVAYYFLFVNPTFMNSLM